MGIIIKYILLFLCLYGSVLTEHLQTSSNDVRQDDTHTFTQVGDSYYLINTIDKMNWFEAMLYCHTHDSDLLTIETEEEMNSLSLYLTLKFHLGKKFWLSASDLAEEGKFMSYSNGRPMAYTKWSDEQPNDWHRDEDCVHLWTVNSTFYMNDNICMAKDFAICEKRMNIRKFFVEGIRFSCDIRKTKDILEKPTIALDCRE